jgi:hypothetical protein
MAASPPRPSLNLRVGMVLYLYADFTYDPKTKYFLVMDPSDPPLLLMINTDIIPAIERRPDLRACQVPLSVRDQRGVIEHDCWVDCTAVFDYLSLADIETQIAKRQGQIKGHLARPSLIEVREALDEDVRIREMEKSRILQQLDRHLD